MTLLTSITLAAWFDMTPAGIKQRYYRDPGSLPPAIRIGSSLRWDPETVRAWLKEQQDKATEQTNALASGPGRSVVVPIAAGADRGK